MNNKHLHIIIISISLIQYGCLRGPADDVTIYRDFALLSNGDSLKISLYQVNNDYFKLSDTTKDIIYTRSEMDHMHLFAPSSSIYFFVSNKQDSVKFDISNKSGWKAEIYKGCLDRGTYSLLLGENLGIDTLYLSSSIGDKVRFRKLFMSK